eukprot:TRINITY_DN18174_c0_g1_i2.p1 TRINITY_DN18174_c0_g1~~TRINITY_DN18174_c0_g1_i2.p1  ORF type:complete len:314 (+),score=59.31 TRINITY_DN18174_c0_g1_i2:115-942(+)
MQVGCLPVGEIKEDIDDSVPPMDGLEYLKRVAHARKYKCPKTVVAKNRDEIMGSGTNCVPQLPKRFLPETKIPPEGWRRSTVARFRELRKVIEASRPARSAQLPPLPKGVPNNRDGVSWKVFCFGGKKKDAQQPSYSILKSLDQVSISWLLVCHKNWFCNSPTAPSMKDLGGDEHFRRMCFQGFGTDGTCGSLSWLYALMACIESPLLAADQTALAELLQKLCQLWNKLHSLTLTDAGVSIDEDLLTGMIATLVTVIHSHFNQGDPSLLWPRDVL